MIKLTARANLQNIYVMVYNPLESFFIERANIRLFIQHSNPLNVLSLFK